MQARIEEELALLRGWFGSGLEYRQDGHWIRIPDYQIPRDIWTPGVIDVAFQMPQGLPGQAPYGFHVRPGVQLARGVLPSNYTYPTSNPWGDGWGSFSWQLEDWRPATAAAQGSNMLMFARSIANRFQQGA